MDEESCISPTDAQQWIYDRNRGQQSVSSFLANNRDIAEEDEEAEAVADELHKKLRRDSEVSSSRGNSSVELIMICPCFEQNFVMPDLTDEDQARLESCMDEIRNVVGEMVSQRQLVETIMDQNYDCNKALDTILNQSKPVMRPTVVLPPREPMETGEYLPVDRAYWRFFY